MNFKTLLLLLFTAACSYAQIVITPQSASQQYLQMSRDESVFIMPKFAAKVATAKAGGAAVNFNILFIGDSLMSGLDLKITRALQGLYGSNGVGYMFGQQGGDSSNIRTLGGGATQITGNTSPNNSSLYCPTANYVRLTGTAQYVEFGGLEDNAGTNPSVIANKLGVLAIRESGGGVFKIQTSTDDGSTWSDEAGFTSVDTSGTATSSFETLITKGSPASYRMRVYAVSGTVKILAGKLKDETRTGIAGHTLAQGTNSGAGTLTYMTNTGTAITSPMMAAIAPDIVIYKQIDGAALVSSLLGTLYTNLRAGYSNGDWIFSTANDTDTQPAADENAAVKAYAVYQNQSFWDDNSWGVSYAVRNAAGLMQDGTHPNATSLGISTSRLLGSCILGYASPLIPGGSQRGMQIIDTWGGSSVIQPIVGFRNINPAPYNEGGLLHWLQKSAQAKGEYTIRNESGSRVLGMTVYPTSGPDVFASMPSLVEFSNSGGSFFLLDSNARGRFGSNLLNQSRYPSASASWRFDNSTFGAATIAAEASSASGAVIATFASGTTTLKWYVDGDGNTVNVTAGSGLKVKEGSNARMGTATLASGSVTVSNTTVTGSTRFVITPTETGTMAGRLRVSARVSGTSFTVSSSDPGDNCTFDWMLIEPAP